MSEESVMTSHRTDEITIGIWILGTIIVLAVVSALLYYLRYVIHFENPIYEIFLWN